MTETPTLSTSFDLDTGTYRVLATSYGSTAPSGLGSFQTEAEAVNAMERLQLKLNEQAGRKQMSRKRVRQFGT